MWNYSLQKEKGGTGDSLKLVKFSVEVGQLFDEGQSPFWLKKWFLTYPGS